MNQTRTRKRLELAHGAIELTPVKIGKDDGWCAAIDGRAGLYADAATIPEAVGLLLISTPELFTVDAADAVQTLSASNLTLRMRETIKESPVQRTPSPVIGPAGLGFRYQPAGDTYEILDTDGVVIDTYGKIAPASHHYNTGHACRPSCCDGVDSKGYVIVPGNCPL